jgi:Txe/YoeB family toxin of Txe-Axe toxin-antitoxin module
MKTKSDTVENKVWVDGKYIQETHSVSRTKAYEIIREIEKENYEPDATPCDLAAASRSVRIL